MEWYVAGLAILGPSSWGGGQYEPLEAGGFGGCTFYDRKDHRAWVICFEHGDALKWVWFYGQIGQRCWQMEPTEAVVLERRLEGTMVHFLWDSRWQHLRWHAWRRLGLATMYKTGEKVAGIKVWFRRRSTGTLMGCISCPHPSRIEHPFILPTVPRCLRPGPWISGQIKLKCTEFWALEAYGIPNN